MAYSYPIWNDVEACIYKSSKSYGVRDTGEVTVKVGTSARNSEFLVKHCTTRRTSDDYTVFTFSVDIGDGYKILKRKWMHTESQEWFDNEPEGLKNKAA